MKHVKVAPPGYNAKKIAVTTNATAAAGAGVGVVNNTSTTATAMVNNNTFAATATSAANNGALNTPTTTTDNNNNSSSNNKGQVASTPTGNMDQTMVQATTDHVMGRVSMLEHAHAGGGGNQVTNNDALPTKMTSAAALTAATGAPKENVVNDTLFSSSTTIKYGKETPRRVKVSSSSRPGSSGSKVKRMSKRHLNKKSTNATAASGVTAASHANSANRTTTSNSANRTTTTSSSTSKNSVGRPRNNNSSSSSSKKSKGKSMTPTIFSPVKMNTLEMEEDQEDGGSVGKVGGLKWSKKEVSSLFCLMIVVVCG